jgi:ubiquinone/menaquinone biosynthesis C-methylase UbiE
MSTTVTDQKQRAIDIHHEQSKLFRERYEEFQRDPYCSAFTYGRRKCDAILEQYLPKEGQGKKLLDAGCGSGYALYTYSQRGYECTGLDAAEGMVENARALNPDLDIRLGDVEKLPYGDESFDYLLNIEVIRYLTDPRICIREFHRVLKPGGTALVTAMPPYTLTGYALLNMLTSRAQVGSLSKVRQYFHSTSWLQRTFQECGFSKVEVHAAFLGPWRNVERVAPRLLPGMLRAWEPMDDRLSRVGTLKDFTNHLVVAAVK